MTNSIHETELTRDDPDQVIEPVGYDFGLSRRTFVQVLGAGLVIAVAAPAIAQERRSRGGGGFRRDSRPVSLEARLHIAKDGAITVMTGKVEGGQGARTEITQAAAEELGIPVARVQLVMGDTAVVPDDGITAGSRTTPGTLPAVRQACAAAKGLLLAFAAKRWGVGADAIQWTDEAAKHDDKTMTYADLAKESAESLKSTAPSDVQVTPAEKWDVLGTPVARPNARDIVTGKHAYPRDVNRPGMLYGKVLRSPTYRGKLKSVDAEPVKEIEGAIPVRDGDFVGVVAPSTYVAKQAIDALARTAQWESSPIPSSQDLYDYLREHAKESAENPFADVVKAASESKRLRAEYHVPYAQHAPLEPRAAVAEWKAGAVTIWTSTQNPFGVRREVASAFHIPEQKVRVIVPDFGGGFGGKHTGETAIEAARLAQAANKPVSLQWTRAEEFTWAYFRPAAMILAEASLDDSNKLSTWHFVNINSGPSAVGTPYRVKNECKFVQSEPPLRHGSYRGLASTANVFARESFMDEMAHLAQMDPLTFRLAHLDPRENERLKTVLETAVKKFDFASRWKTKSAGTGVGLACAMEKGSYVAACAEVQIQDQTRQGKRERVVKVNHVTQAFECGAITNPANLLSQVQGAIVQGLGPALREEIEIKDNAIANASFWEYRAPRFADVPVLDVELIDRKDLPSAGAGETPLIAIAPAIANAVFHATGERIRQMPITPTVHA